MLSIKGAQHLEVAFQITLYLEAKGSDLTGDFLEAHWKHPVAMILHVQLHHFHAVLSQWREGQQDISLSLWGHVPLPPKRATVLFPYINLLEYELGLEFF